MLAFYDPFRSGAKVKVKMTPYGGRDWTGDEGDKKSLNVKVLIKTFKLILNMAISGGWPLVTPLGGGVQTGGEWDPI